MEEREQIPAARVELDRANQRFWIGDRPTELTPKSFALAVYLAERAGVLVTKDELLDALWGATSVGDGVLKVCVREIRKALGDDARTPRVIETLHRRGYRFIAEVVERAPAPSRDETPVIAARGASAQASPAEALSVALVGRERELEQMEAELTRALAGTRRTLFVTGAPGIGKTSLIDAFAREARVSAREAGVSGSSPARAARVSGFAPDLWIARGQCLEQYGAGEAYMPVLDALARLCRGDHGRAATQVLERTAPTWLAQLRPASARAENEALRRELLGSTGERMLREMGEATEALCAERPLVLVLEDLQWSDPSTLDLIAFLARRRESARLLLICASRPPELTRAGHPLKTVQQELLMHRLASECALDLLAPDELARYLELRFPGHHFPAELAMALHRRTEGHPLFLVNVVDYLESRGALVRGADGWELRGKLADVESNVPDGVRAMIDLSIGWIAPEERAALDAASAVGIEFSAVAVAAALASDIAPIEELCDRMCARGQFLRPAGVSEFPDGSASARYRFTHGLYASVLHDALGPAQRMRLHQRIGERGELLFGERAAELAPELALHFSEARDFRRAVHWLRQAARTDVRRYAWREAVANLDRALEACQKLPLTEREPLESELCEERALARRSMGDMRGAARDFERLATLARERGTPEREVQALLYLASALFWVDRARCLSAIDRATELGDRLADPLLRAHTLGYCAHWNLNLRGFDERHVEAGAHAVEAARRAGDRRLLALHVVRFSYALFLQAHYRQARESADEGLALALEVGDAFDWFLAQFFRGWAALHEGAWGQARSGLASGLEMADKNGQRQWSMLFRLELAQLHAQAMDFEGARRLCEDVLAQVGQALEERGQIVFHASIVLAGAQIGLGNIDGALATLAEVDARLAQPGSLMDRMLTWPLLFAWSEARLARGELDRARERARALFEHASRSHEVTYLALAREVEARIALASGDLETAERCLSEAERWTESGAAPLAAWRVDATRAALHARRKRKSAANDHHARAARTLGQLAASLDESDELRGSVARWIEARGWMRAARA